MTQAAANGHEATLVDLTRRAHGDQLADSLDIQLQQRAQRER